MAKETVLNCFMKVSFIIYQKSYVIRVVEIIKIDDETFSALQPMLKKLCPKVLLWARYNQI